MSRGNRAQSPRCDAVTCGSGDAVATKKQTGNGAGASDGLATLVDAAVEAARKPVVEPVPDFRVSAAFALGWQMAELYRPEQAPGPKPAASDDLPGLGRLDAQERAQIALEQVDAALAKLSEAIKAAGLGIPSTRDLHSCFDKHANTVARRGTVRALHGKLLATLTAADFRLGKAYGLGRSMADTCRNPVSAATLEAEFKPHRVAKLCGWLDDLATAFPPHAGHSVRESLKRWDDALNNPKHQPPVDPEVARRTLGRQGQLWRSLLSGEKSGPDMLVIGNYLDAAGQLLNTNGRIALRFVYRMWYLVLLIVVLFGLGIYALLNTKNSGTIAAGVSSILASVGLTWKSAGSTLGGLGAKVEHNLWGAELDTAIADAVTLLPDNKRDHAGRGHTEPLSMGEPTTGPFPHPELLEPVIDPDQLLTKIDRLQAQQRVHEDDLAVLPSEQRLPVGYFDRLRAAVTAEQADPHRVIRAVTPPSDPAVSSPPPVVYLSRRPTVSQFMSVITHCVESTFEQQARNRDHHLFALDQLWRDVERWTEDLRSRFRQYGPCDIRWIEPKLAQALADVFGRHEFITEPPEVAVGDQAVVIVLGDWATGLPQARNVAARIREHLQRLPAGTECHVIHLGDTYYSCLEDEVRRRFLDLWPVPPGSTARSWSLAGNHDMYGGGHGYFDVLLADTRFARQNRCSYFALQNASWQILGLDSSYKDPDRADLQDPQAEWLSQRIGDASLRGTVLMTHHQPFSPYEEVTAPLAGTVARALGSCKLDAWLWGHEHRCAVYDPNLEWAPTGYDSNTRYAAVIGHGGVPNLLADQQAGPNAPDVEWQLADYYDLGDDHWGLGGFAVLEFDGPKLSIQYYDEYGKERRDGNPLGYASESAGIEQVLRTPDPRPVRPPDVLRPGAAEQPDRALHGMAATPGT